MRTAINASDAVRGALDLGHFKESATFTHFQASTTRIP